MAVAISGLPSPSISIITTWFELRSVVESVISANEVLAKGAPGLGKVIKKGLPEYAVSPLAVTVMGLQFAPAGAVTVRLVAVAAVTLARTAPKKTILFDAVELKLVPVIVTVVPMGPELGLNDVIVGCAITHVKKHDPIISIKKILICAVLVWTNDRNKQSIRPIINVPKLSE